MRGNRVYVDGYASLIEASLSNKQMVGNLLKADILVNPLQSTHMNKMIIINLPIDVPISRLRRYNKIISRFPIGHGIEVQPYDIPPDRKEVNKEDYSLLILDKEMLSDLNYANAVKDGNFLLGNDELVDDEMSLTGYLIMRTKIENL